MDVLVLTDEPAFPGCLAECRVTDIIEAEQSEKDEKERKIAWSVWNGISAVVRE
jgi:inorganic pyrophosphatase